MRYRIHAAGNAYEITDHEELQVARDILRETEIALVLANCPLLESDGDDNIESYSLSITRLRQELARENEADDD